jgi:hypothetical protein
MDFLSSLAARNLNEPASGATAGATSSVPVLQPRVPARFEPAVPQRDIPLDHAGEEDATPAARAADERPDAAQSQQAGPATIRNMSAAAQPGALSGAYSRDRDVEPDSRVVRVIERLVRETNTIRIVTPAPSALPGQSMVDTARPDVSASPSSSGRPAGREASLVPAVPRARREESVAPRSQPAALPDAVPVINVTIGRIEVRAAPPPRPAQAPAQEPASRVMSLEEILRERNGGGR